MPGYRDILDYGGLLADLERSQLSNVDKAVDNARAFAVEVVARLKAASTAAEER
ncbi:MAG: hypothetical protein II336_16540 [Loktanella sp.]|nr:hypothetical protein [Loktanella sp.]